MNMGSSDVLRPAAVVTTVLFIALQLGEPDRSINSLPGASLVSRSPSTRLCITNVQYIRPQDRIPLFDICTVDLEIINGAYSTKVDFSG